MRSYFDAGDYDSSKGKTKLDKEIDEKLANDKLYKKPNLKLINLFWVVIGALCGVILNSFLIKFHLWWAIAAVLAFAIIVVIALKLMIRRCDRELAKPSGINYDKN